MSIVARVYAFLTSIGESIIFLGQIISLIFRRGIRFNDVLNQVYEQGVSSVMIVMLTACATGMVLGLQGFTTLTRFGAKEFVAQLVALSLVRELGPVFTALIFSGKAGSRMTAELGTMSANEQIQATRVMGVEPIELLVIPRFVACVLVLPVLV